MTLSPELVPLLRSAVEGILPGDDDPSGWELGAGDYIERHAAGVLAADLPRIEAGLRALDAAARARNGVGFAALEGSLRDALLGDAEAGRIDGASPAFFARLCAIVAEGCYADPGNGGNREGRAFRMVGYREAGAAAAQHARTELTLTRVSAIAPEYDVVVVGSGAGGAVVARALAQAGLSVLVLERGPWLPRGELSADHLRNHRFPRYGQNLGPEAEGNPRVLVDRDGREHVPPPHHPLWNNNAMGVGGGTRVYGAQAWRFLPEDFRLASLYGAPKDSSLADWPFDYEALEPYYDRAEWEVGVCGAAGAHRRAGPRRRGYPMPPTPDDPQRALLGRAAERLGWSSAPVPLAINSVPFDGRPACVRCGTCVGFACRSESKNGAHTLLPHALATGRCVLVTGAQVTRVLCDGARRVRGVVGVALDADPPRAFQVAARAVVLCAGAIESARLLLASAGPEHPSGIGNAHDQVGRNLQGHVYAGAYGVFDEVVQESEGPGPSISSCEFNHGNPGVIGGGMLANDFVTLPVMFWHLARPPGVPAWGAANKEWMRRDWRRTALVMGPTQEIPLASARVEIDSCLRDRAGMPAVRLSGGVHPETLRSAQVLRARAEEWLRAAGARRTWSFVASDGRSVSAGQHQAGTCRLGADPRSSVTDPVGRVHGIDNLWIADASLHVTNGGFNPVLTVFALACRTAEHIVQSMRT